MSGLLLIWFLLVAFMLAAYVVLDGFDLGVGILHLFLARTEEERSEVLQEWKETKKQAAKDERQFWLFWFVVIAALGLYFNYFR